MSDMNPNPIQKRLVYKIEAVLASPALIGSGESESTDSDVLLNASGNPYLPGSALAGVLRHTLDEKDADLLFGSLASEKMSALWVMDSKFTKNKDVILTRDDIMELDGVALDPENKTALAKRKYDFQAVPGDARFTIRLMLVLREKDQNGAAMEALTERLLSQLRCGGISVGAKAGRGFGRVKCTAIQRQVFDYRTHDRTALDRWIQFEWDTDTGWEPYTPARTGASDATMTAVLKLCGSIMIRDTGSLDGDEDFKHISCGGEPVIYGTSWAGAFRGGLHKLLKPLSGQEALQGKQVDKYLDEFFGFVREENALAEDDGRRQSASRLRFDMSVLEKEAGREAEQGYRTITRVKINRFTGGAADGALFTERPWAGGKTTLVVRYPAGDTECEKLIRIALDAMHRGILTIGGETAIGRGVFQVVSEQYAKGGDAA